MKRIITIILTIIMLLSLASCGTGGAPAPTAEPTEAPADKPFYTVNLGTTSYCSSRQPVCETESSIYFLCEETATQYIVYFSDKEYHDWMPLCGKPECDHKTSSCNARLEGYAGGSIWLYGDHLYYFVENERTGEPETIDLYRMDLDGSDHEKLLQCELPLSAQNGTNYSWYWFFHNKYAFLQLACSKQIIDSGEIEVDVTMYFSDLSKDAPSLSTLDFINDEIKSIGQVFLFMAGQGETVYAAAMNDIYKIELASNSIEKLCSLSFCPDRCFYSEKENRLFFSDPNDRNSFSCVDIGTRSVNIHSDETTSAQWDIICNGYIFGNSPRDPFEGMPWGPADAGLDPETDFEALWCTNVYDLNGNLLIHIPHEDYNDENIVIRYITGNYVFGVDYLDSLKNGTRRPPEWYLNLSEMGTDSFMWRRWEP